MPEILRKLYGKYVRHKGSSVDVYTPSGDSGRVDDVDIFVTVSKGNDMLICIKNSMLAVGDESRDAIECSTSEEYGPEHKLKDVVCIETEHKGTKAVVCGPREMETFVEFVAENP